MSLHDFILVHSDEILAAFRAELVDGRSPNQVAMDAQAKFLALAQMARESSRAERAPDGLSMVGESPAMSALRTRIDQLSSRSRAPVSISGEAGVGKRHCARALHRATYPNGRWFDLDDPADLPELERHLLVISKS